MKQTNFGSRVLPAVCTSSTATQSSRSKRSLKTMLLGSILVVLSLPLFSGIANAQYHLNNSVLTCTNAKTPATVCSKQGGYASGWSTTGAPNSSHWTYNISTAGYTGISFAFSSLRSATGATSAQIWYNSGSGDVLLTTVSGIGTGCTAFGPFSLPSSCDDNSSVVVTVYPYGATGSAGTQRMQDTGVFQASGTLLCSGTPTGGSASAATATFCGSGSTIVTLSGASSGRGIHIQWQRSTTSPTSGFSNLGVADTNLTYNTGTLTPGTYYYRATVTCTLSSTTVNSTSTSVQVYSLPSVAAVTGSPFPIPVTVGSSVTLGETSTGGSWSSSNTSVATVDASGDVTAVTGGTTKISYIVTDANHCSATASAYVDAAWPNTLALYAGGLDNNGNGTHVTGVNYDTARDLVPTGFGSATTCSTGGLSGLTMSTAITSYASTNPHVSYIVKPQAGKALNIYRIAAKTRESSNGPTKARIAYNYHGTWIDENRDVTQTTGGSCGANSNSWDYATTTGGVIINGIVDSIEVAVFPYAPGASTGTFQLNALEVYGTVSDSTHCSGTPANGGYISPVAAYICDSGSKFLTIDTGTFTGTAGVGITYQWDSSADGTNFYPSMSPGNNNIALNAGNPVKFHATGSSQMYFYTLVTTCTDLFGATHSANSDTAVVNVNARPVPPTISGLASNSTINVGQSVTLSPASTTPGHTYLWSSNDTSAASIGRTNGILLGHLPGYATITLIDSINGCYATSKDTFGVEFANTVALYLGRGGNSTATSTPVAGASTTAVAQSGFTLATACGSGGISGLTEGTGVTGFSSSNPNVNFTFTAGSSSVPLGMFHTTVRISATGPTNMYLAYNLNGAGFVPAGPIDISGEVDNCGYSHTDIYTDLTGVTVPATGSLVLGVFPTDPATATGTFQVNSIDLTGNCPVLGSDIIDENSGNPLNGEVYNSTCTDAIGPIPVDFGAGPVSGVWSSNNSAVTIDNNGNMTFNDAITTDQTVTITFANGCSAPVSATFTLSVTAGGGCNGFPKTAPSGVAAVKNLTNVQFYPNPTNNVLNIKAAQIVNVTVESIDGKSLLHQDNAKAIDVSKLASGMYLIRVYDVNNTLIKTSKFVKQ